MRMTNEDWKYKIINASPKRLVIVTYEIILDRLDSAAFLLERGDMEGFRAKVGNAREFVSELICSLDTSNSVSLELADLYLLVNRLLAKAYFQCLGSNLSAAKNAKKLLRQSEEIFKTLMKSLEKEVDDQRFLCAEATGNYSFCGVYGKRATGMY